MSAGPPAPGSGWARITYPPAVKTGLDEFAERCGWKIRTFDGHRYVRTEESYDGRADAGLLRLHPLITPGTPWTEQPEGFRVLERLPDQEGFLGADLDKPITEQLTRYETDQRLGTAVAYLQLLFTTLPTQQLPDRLRELYDRVARQVDDKSSLHLLRLAPELTWRAAVARTLLAVDFSPDALMQTGGDFPGFNSAKAVLNGMTYGAVPYIAPALLTGTPYVNGLMTMRAGANLIWLFGRPLAGRQRPTDELLEAVASAQTRFSYGIQSAYERPAHDRAASLDVLRWWVGRVNALLAMATDVGRFVGPDCAYQPRRHFTFLLSLERLFSDLHQTLAEAGRNETVRLRLAYDALDCMDGMRAGSFADMTSPRKARRALTDLQVVLPDAVAQVLLPRCEAAVEALEQVRDGFFLSNMVTENGLAGVPGLTPGQVLGWDKATAQYLRIDRNSAHSFLNELEPDAEALKFGIFAAHDARLSPLIADVALLWVVRLLAEPWRLERPLTAPWKGRRQTQRRGNR